MRTVGVGTKKELPEMEVLKKENAELKEKVEELEKENAELKAQEPEKKKK